MWIRVENPDTKEVNLVDLSKVENAKKSADGTVALSFSGGRTVTLEGKGGWVDVAWSELLKIAGM